MSKDRPILFSALMVRAILAGTKTQTRRLFKMPKGLGWYHGGPQLRGEETGDVHELAGPGWWSIDELRCPYGRPGDRLWVRETFGHFERNDALKPGDEIFYRADGQCSALEPWRPCIHMPRWASRTSLEVTGDRVGLADAL